MNTSKKPRLAAVSLAVALILSVTACGKNDNKAEAKAATGKEAGHAEGDAVKLSAEEASRAGVKAEPLNAQKLASTIVLTATIQADQDRVARVAPRTEGRITSAPAKLGDRVRAGETLAVLDSVSVGEAYAALSQAQSELRIAEADFERAQALVADEIIPRKDFLRAQSERDKAAANVRAASGKLRLLGANPTAAGGVSRFAVAAPFAGTIIEKKATLGDLATPSAPLFTIADLSRVWIVADLPEAALAKVRVGAMARVTVPSYANDLFGGRVSYIGAALNKESRTVAARIEVPNTDGRLKPDMFATATIEVSGDNRDIMSLPDAAVVIMDGQPTIFVLENSGYVARKVQTGERMGGRTEITAGVKPGEQVVTAGTYELKARKQKSQLGEGH